MSKSDCSTTGEAIYNEVFKEIFDNGDGEAILKTQTDYAKEINLHPLGVAVSMGHVEAIKKMVFAGLDINMELPQTGNYTALHIAVAKNQIEVIEVLLDCGANIALTNHEGNNPFMMAVNLGKAEAVNKLWSYRKNFNINAQNKVGQSALHIASKNSWESCTVMLVKGGAAVDIYDSEGNTPLMISCRKGDQKCVSRLSNAGAYILAENKENVTALCMAITNSKKQVCDYLLSKLTEDDKEFYVTRRIEALRTTIKTPENADFIEDFLLMVMTFLWWNEGTRKIMSESDFIRPWLETIQSYHKTDSLEIDIPLMTLAICLVDNYDDVYHQKAVKTFIDYGGHEMVLKLIDMYTDNDIINAMILLLVPLTQNREGKKWLRKNYASLLAVVDVFNEEFDTSDLMSSLGCTNGSELMFGFGNKRGAARLEASIKQFTETFRKIQTEKSDQACRELLASEAKEKAKKERQLKKEKAKQHSKCGSDKSKEIKISEAFKCSSASPKETTSSIQTKSTNIKPISDKSKTSERKSSESEKSSMTSSKQETPSSNESKKKKKKEAKIIDQLLSKSKDESFVPVLTKKQMREIKKKMNQSKDSKDSSTEVSTSSPKPKSPAYVSPQKKLQSPHASAKKANPEKTPKGSPLRADSNLVAQISTAIDKSQTKSPMAEKRNTKNPWKLPEVKSSTTIPEQNDCNSSFGSMKTVPGSPKQTKANTSATEGDLNKLVRGGDLTFLHPDLTEVVDHHQDEYIQQQIEMDHQFEGQIEFLGETILSGSSLESGQNSTRNNEDDFDASLETSSLNQCDQSYENGTSRDESRISDVYLNISQDTASPQTEIKTTDAMREIQVMSPISPCKPVPENVYTWKPKSELMIKDNVQPENEITANTFTRKESPRDDIWRPAIDRILTQQDTPKIANLQNVRNDNTMSAQCFSKNDYEVFQINTFKPNPVLFPEQNLAPSKLVDISHLKSFNTDGKNEDEFARLSPDLDPLYDEELKQQNRPLNFTPGNWQCSRLQKPQEDEFAKLLQMQRSMAPVHGNNYGYDTQWTGPNAFSLFGIQQTPGIPKNEAIPETLHAQGEPVPSMHVSLGIENQTKSLGLTDIAERLDTSKSQNEMSKSDVHNSKLQQNSMKVERPDYLSVPPQNTSHPGNDTRNVDVKLSCKPLTKFEECGNVSMIEKAVRTFNINEPNIPSKSTKSLIFDTCSKEQEDPKSKSHTDILNINVCQLQPATANASSKENVGSTKSISEENVLNVPQDTANINYNSLKSVKSASSTSGIPSSRPLRVPQKTSRMQSSASLKRAAYTLKPSSSADQANECLTQGPNSEVENIMRSSSKNDQMCSRNLPQQRTTSAQDCARNASAASNIPASNFANVSNKNFFYLPKTVNAHGRNLQKVDFRDNKVTTSAPQTSCVYMIGKPMLSDARKELKPQESNMNFNFGHFDQKAVVTTSVNHHVKQQPIFTGNFSNQNIKEHPDVQSTNFFVKSSQYGNHQIQMHQGLHPNYNIQVPPPRCTPATVATANIPMNGIQHQGKTLSGMIPSEKDTNVFHNNMMEKRAPAKSIFQKPVKVPAWSKWKPAFDAFIKAQWMFKYRIDQVAIARHADHYIVGKGTNGSVVMLGQMLDGSEVAVKRIPLNKTLMLQENVHGLINSNIQHKNLLSFLHLELDHDYGYMVMELCEFNLSQHIFILKNRGHLGPEIGLHLAKEMMLAIEFLHATGIVHGRLKPENILIDGMGKLRVSDYGLALGPNGKILQDEERSLWRTNEPEGYKTDIQSLGMLIYYTLTGGCHPYGDKQDVILRRLAAGKPGALKVVSEEANDLFKVLLFYPPESRPTVTKALRHPYFLDTSQRHQLMLAVEKELSDQTPCHHHLLSQLTRKDLYPIASGWINHIRGRTLDKVLHEIIKLRQGQTYPNNMLGLLTFMANVTACAQAMLNPALHKELGDPAPRFCGMFPHLPMCLYRVMRRVNTVSNTDAFSHYF